VSFTAGHYTTVRDTTRPSGDPRGQSMITKVNPAIPSTSSTSSSATLDLQQSLRRPLRRHALRSWRGFNGTMVKRLKLLKTRGYHRTTAQAGLHGAMVFAGVHALTMHRQVRKAATAAHTASGTSAPVAAAA
jgi:hypothetical protein